MNLQLDSEQLARQECATEAFAFIRGLHYGRTGVELPAAPTKEANRFAAFYAGAWGDYLEKKSSDKPGTLVQMYLAFSGK